MHTKFYAVLSVGAAAATVLIAGPAGASGHVYGANLLSNGNLIDASTNSPSHIVAGPGTAGGWTAARNWAVAINTPTQTDTWGVSSTRTPFKSMLRVCSTGADNGIAQQFAAGATGPVGPQVSAWVFVESGGPVAIGAGDGGSLGLTGTTTGTGVWQQIIASTGAVHVNEVLIATTVAATTCYDVDEVVVQPVIG